MKHSTSQNNLEFSILAINAIVNLVGYLGCGYMDLWCLDETAVYETLNGNRTRQNPETNT